jgi:hypothetical protein
MQVFLLRDIKEGALMALGRIGRIIRKGRKCTATAKRRRFTQPVSDPLPATLSRH